MFGRRPRRRGRPGGRRRRARRRRGRPGAAGRRRSWCASSRRRARRRSWRRGRSVRGARRPGGTGRGTSGMRCASGGVYRGRQATSEPTEAGALPAPSPAGMGIPGEGMVPHRRRSEVEVLGKTCRSGGPGPSSLCPWSRLWASLVRWLRRRVWAQLDPEDVASETVLRTLRVHGPTPAAPWAAVWSWSVGVARHVIAEARRAIRRLSSLEEADELACPQVEESPSDPAWLEDLADVATPAQRQVLLMMSNGVTRTQDLAEQLGCSVRAVELRREGLRVTASHTGNLCRHLRSRVIL